MNAQALLDKEFAEIPAGYYKTDRERLKELGPWKDDPIEAWKHIREWREISAMMLSSSTYVESYPPRGMYMRKYLSVAFAHLADALERHIKGEPQKNDQRPWDPKTK